MSVRYSQSASGAASRIEHRHVRAVDHERPGPVAVELALGGRDQLAVLAEVREQALAERDQSLDRRRARAQRRRPADQVLLQPPLVLGQQREDEPGAVAEPAEQRALADARLGGDGVHRHAVGAALGEQLLGRGQDLVAVARRVGAQRRLVLEDREQFHCGQRNGHRGGHCSGQPDRSPFLVLQYCSSRKRTAVRSESLNRGATSNDHRNHRDSRWHVHVRRRPFVRRLRRQAHARHVPRRLRRPSTPRSSSTTAARPASPAPFRSPP